MKNIKIHCSLLPFVTYLNLQKKTNYCCLCTSFKIYLPLHIKHNVCKYVLLLKQILRYIFKESVTANKVVEFHDPH